MKILSIFNNKGGVGKSTLTFHLGAALALRGKKVLMIDLDPQSNLTLYGVSDYDLEKIWNSEDDFIDDFAEAKRKMGQQQFDEYHKKHHSIHYLIKPVEDGISDENDLCEPVRLNKNLSLIPGRLTLHMFENKLSKQWSEAFLGEAQAIRIVTSIRKKCEEYALKFGFEIILIDTSPSLSVLNKVIISNTDTFIIPCAPDMFSDYGIRNIGSALSIWKREFETMYSLLSDSKRHHFPKNFVRLLGYTVYNAKKRSDANNDLSVAQAHFNYAEKLPATIKKYIPESCLAKLSNGAFEHSLGKNAVIHGHGTLPTMAQKYKLPMWDVPNHPNLEEERSTIKGNAKLYYATKAQYLNLADDILIRLGSL